MSVQKPFLLTLAAIAIIVMGFATFHFVRMVYLLNTPSLMTARYHGGGIISSHVDVCTDGKSIIVSMIGSPTRESPSVSELYRVDLATGQRTRLFNAFNYDGQPNSGALDGKIAFVSERAGAASIWYLSRGMNDPERVTNHERNEHCPVLSPDGSTIYFARSAPEMGDSTLANDIYSFNFMTKQERRLTTNKLCDVPLRCNHDGSLLYFSRGAGLNDCQFFELDLKSGSERELVAVNASQCYDVSETGRLLLFSRRADKGQGAWQYELFVADLDGKHERQLTMFGSQVQCGRFTPDGKHVVVTVSRLGAGDNVHDVYIVSVEDGKSRKLSDCVK